MRISVIMPVLDEAARLGMRLDELAGHGFDEIIVVDGGSRDTSREIARAAGVTLVDSPRGRARQMNAGAAQAAGDILLFLHADARLPRGARGRIEAAMAARDVAGGAFRIRTVDDDGRGGWARPLLPLADMRSRYSRLPYGDQAVFVRADAFRALGGYPNQPLMEDLEFALQLRRRGRIVIAPDCVEVSGRRFLARPLYYTALVNIYPLLYRFGVPPARLARWYRHQR